MKRTRQKSQVTSHKSVTDRCPLTAVLCILAVLCPLTISLAGTMTYLQGAKTVTTAGTPVAMVASSTIVAAVEIYPSKNTTTANTGTILIGFTAGAGNQKRPLPKDGPPMVLVAEPGKTLDLKNIYLDAATSGDGVVWSAIVRQ
jgi:hypothetical protein